MSIYGRHPCRGSVEGSEITSFNDSMGRGTPPPHKFTWEVTECKVTPKYRSDFGGKAHSWMFFSDKESV